jgi:signal transduction histidine kinase
MGELERGSSVFKPKARLLSLLGDQLITNDVVAVVELIKNSFDADSTKVTLTLENVTNPDEGTIIVEDDGVGMSLETIQNVWLEPGTDFRKSQRESGKKTAIFGRPILGEKGIGRFAAHRLGNLIELITKPENAELEIEVEVNWSLFKGSKYLEDVPIYWMRRHPKVFIGKKHGTRLIIKNLKKSWTDDMVVDLAEKLEALQAPLKDKYNFETVIFAPEFQFSQRKAVVLDDILKNATYRFEGYVDENGIVDATYTFRHEAFPNEARNCDVQEDLRKDSKRFFTKKNEPKKPCCGSFIVRLHAWDLDPVNLKETVTRKYYDAVIKPHTGIRLYRDGFRVWPYGELGNDWLGLDSRRVNNPSKCLSNNQTIGLVNISGESNSNLMDKTDREGLIDNEAYADFSELVLSAVNQFEIKRNEDKLRIASLRTKERRIDRTIFAIDSLKEKMRKKAELETYSQDIKDIENAYENEVHETIEPLIVSAGVGIAYMMPAHEIITSIQDLEKLIHTLEKELESLNVGGRIAKTTLSMLEITSVVKDVADGALELTRRKGDVFLLRSAVDSSVDIKEPTLKNQKIKLEVREKAKLSIRGHQNLVMTCLLNLLDNAIFWLSQKENKMIRITIDRDADNYLRVIVSDNGPGIRKEDLRFLGEAYWTRKPRGTGLGLFISKRAMNANSGSIEFGFFGEDPSYLQGANVILKFPSNIEVKR